MLRYILGRYKEPLKKFYLRYRKIILAVYLPFLRMGSRKKCNVCSKTLGNFRSFKGGAKYLPEWIIRLEMIGSDVDNFGCPYCSSIDRERHLFMYFDKLQLWDIVKDGHVLHFAPEPHLALKIDGLKPVRHVKGDLFPANDTIQKIDATAIAFPDSSFDLILMNHVLEHIPDYKRAMREVYRVLKPGGVAILQTPFSKVLQQNFEDPGINTDELKLFFYAQRDHVRVFSEITFRQGLAEAGFELAFVKHSDLFTDHDAFYHGVNRKEDLVRVLKSNRVIA